MKPATARSAATRSTRTSAWKPSYRRLADTQAFGADIKFDQIAVSAIGTIPLSNGFNVYGRLGYNRLTVKASANGNSATDHENKALYGIGLGYAFSPTIMGRLEVQKPESDITNISLKRSVPFLIETAQATKKNLLRQVFFRRHVRQFRQEYKISKNLVVKTAILLRPVRRDFNPIRKNKAFRVY
ncbi:porin family protein [Massilia sp. H-1]|nr:porin family protein [Massilia sp. H-1]